MKSIFQTLIFLPLITFSLAAPANPGKAVPSDRLNYKEVWGHDFGKSKVERTPSNKAFKMIAAKDGNTEFTGINPTNLRLDKDHRLHIIPHGPSETYENLWTSGKIETVNDQFGAEPGKKMIWETRVMVGDALSKNQQGVQQDIYLLGTEYRSHQNSYPRMGELDILKLKDGAESFIPTLHCGEESEGPCNEPTGYQQGEAEKIPRGEWARLGLEIDRSMCSGAEDGSCWELESVNWLLNGRAYRTLTGREFGDKAAWARLAHSKKFLTMSVTVGGEKGSSVNKDTLDGDSFGMQVDWVRVFESK
ncbi:related to endo-1,3-beta-glucanase [Phialocephala subalpina]|uniref:Related to endo-1,3-beta-glucanase n=1 Tax=Phialocephala subalpina TaxID=576137 RepID=A0A1L7XHV8_9HELO|nr:related to endo-1,3-beta-glucanase [Phialocephala subalpina]